MRIRPAQLILLSIGGLILALLLFLQTASSVLMPKDPRLASTLMPLNGLALEQAASRKFIGGVKQQEDITASAKAAAPLALSAFARDPLSPKAIAIMAMAEDDLVKRRSLLDAGTRVNKRDLMLQGVVLETQIADEDYESTLQTLDYILRVHPEQKSTFFKVLADALKNDDAVMALGGIFDRTSPWHDDFLQAAAAERGALPNLAKLRLARDDIDPATDGRLISGLVAGGNVDKAFEVYELAVAQAKSSGGDKPKQAWDSNYPPFDWRLANDAAFRAQPSLSGDGLEIFVRGGKGGILAERLIRAAPTGRVATVEHSISPAAQVKDVRLQVSCPGDAEPILDQPFSKSPAKINIPPMASRCDFMRVIIYARAWSGRSAIRGDITRLDFAAN